MRGPPGCDVLTCREMSRPRAIVVLIGLLGVVFSPVLVWACLFAFVLSMDQCNRLDLPYHGEPIPFDAKAWRDAYPSVRSPRLRMLDDLIASHTLIGKTKAEVISLLGPDRLDASAPSEETRDRLRAWDMRITVGSRNLSRGWFDPFSIDFSYVVMRFGKDGRVVEVGVVEEG